MEKLFHNITECYDYVGSVADVDFIQESLIDGLAAVSDESFNIDIAFPVI